MTRSLLGSAEASSTTPQCARPLSGPSRAPNARPGFIGRSTRRSGAIGQCATASDRRSRRERTRWEAVGWCRRTVISDPHMHDGSPTYRLCSGVQLLTADRDLQLCTHILFHTDVLRYAPVPAVGVSGRYQPRGAASRYSPLPNIDISFHFACCYHGNIEWCCRTHRPSAMGHST